MSEELLFLDVNVPMYAAGRPSPYREACAWVLTEIAEGNLPAAIDTEIVQEILYRYGALGQWALAAEMATALLDLVPVVLPVTPSAARQTIPLFEQYGPQGVTARDVLHAAVMHTNSLTHIISTDRHYDLLPDVIRLDPQDLLAGGANGS